MCVKRKYTTNSSSGFVEQGGLGFITVRSTTRGQTIEVSSAFLEEKLGIICYISEKGGKRHVEMTWGKDAIEVKPVETRGQP